MVNTTHRFISNGVIGCILFAILLLPLASAQVVIEQAYYDPVGTESGGEFVVLFNNGTIPINVSKWTLATSSSATDMILPLGLFLGAGQHYLIADTGWNASKDNADWPEADLEDTMTLKNTDSGIALLDVEGSVVDAVGWGNALDATLYEGTPTNGTKPGESLQRQRDTDDNRADFIAGTPRFTQSLESGEIGVRVTVLDPFVTILSFDLLEDDDSTSFGYQFMPYPGTTRLLPLRVVLKSSRNVTVHAALETERNQLALLSSSGEEHTFQGSVVLPYHLVPGSYNITLTADDGQDVAVALKDVEILPLIALDVTLDEVDFGSLLPGESKRIVGDTDVTTPAPTLRNIGNVQTQVAYTGSDLVSGAYSMNASAISLSLAPDFAPSFTRTLSRIASVLEYAIDTRGTAPLGFELLVPEHAVGGTYTGTITITGVGAQ